jgi:hypothetical protein
LPLAAPEKAASGMKKYSVLIQRGYLSSRALSWVLITGLLLIAALGLIPLIADWSSPRFAWPEADAWLMLGQFIAIGFVAQIIDGSLGMAYGITSTSFLMGLGVPPASASAAIHVAEVFTTGVSGLAHLRMGNVSRVLAFTLILPGVLGAAAGAWLLTHVNPAAIKPWVAAYLAVMSLVILRKVIAKPLSAPKPAPPALLALVGGCLDSIGGGGWGPIVTSSLLGSKGQKPRKTIGSVNLAEFFVALTSAGVFTIFTGVKAYALIITGLILGGMAAAPLAAWVCKRVPPRYLMGSVAAVILFLSCRTFWLMGS